MLSPIEATLRDLGLAARFEVLSIPSGYPAPKFVNVTLRRSHGEVLLVESGPAEAEAHAALTAALDARGIRRLDAIASTHTHGDHAGAAYLLACRGRSADVPAPIYLHSAGHRLITNTPLEFLDEGHGILVARSHRGIDDFVEGYAPEAIGKYLRADYADRYARTPRSALHFVDHGHLPRDLVALHTPGHSDDCVFYLDVSSGVGFPGDTMLAGGKPDEPAGHRVMIPPLTVLQQRYSRAVESYLRTIGRLRRFFERERVRAVVPPHGRLAIVDPVAWTHAAEAHFAWLHRELDARIAQTPAPFSANDLLDGLVPEASTPMALSGHVVGLLCMYADFGYLDGEEGARSRRLTFRPRRPLPPTFVADRVREDATDLVVYGAR